MTIIEQIRKELFELNQKYIDEAEDNYDFWSNHIKYVVSEAIELAKTHNADLEIVELGALLHDIAGDTFFRSQTSTEPNSEISRSTSLCSLLRRWGCRPKSWWM